MKRCDRRGVGYQPAITERNRPAGKVAHATAKPQITAETPMQAHERLREWKARWR